MYSLIVVTKLVPRPALLQSTVLPVDFPSNRLLIMESHLYRQRLITRKKRLRLPLNDLAVIKKVTLHIEIQCVKKPISIRRVDSHCYIMNNKWCTLWQTSHLMLINMLYVYHWIFIKLCFMDNYINVDIVTSNMKRTIIVYMVFNFQTS